MGFFQLVVSVYTEITANLEIEIWMAIHIPSNFSMLAVARSANSTWPVFGLEVMRLALTAVGPGWLATPTRWPILNQVTEVTYDWFASHRVGLSRRCGALFALLNPEYNLTCQPPGERADKSN